MHIQRNGLDYRRSAQRGGKADTTRPNIANAHQGTAIRCPWLSLAIIGLGMCVARPQAEARPLRPVAPMQRLVSSPAPTQLTADSQTLTSAPEASGGRAQELRPPKPLPVSMVADRDGLAGEDSPLLMRGHFAVEIPKKTHLNASTLVRVAIWDQRADAPAQATLEASPLLTTHVLVGQLLRVELAALHSGEFAIHAMTPTTQRLLAGRLVLWEWTIVPLQPGEHELSVVATNLEDWSSKPLTLTVHSGSIKVEVTHRQGPGQNIGPLTQAIPSTAALPPARSQGVSTFDCVEGMNEGDTPGLDANKGRVAAFFNRMKMLVRSEWHPDQLFTQHDPAGHIYCAINRTTLLWVQLQPDGRIADLKVMRSSGVEFLDEEAMNAFRRAQPFASPPLPLVDDDGFIRFNFGFTVNAKSGLKRTEVR